MARQPQHRQQIARRSRPRLLNQPVPVIEQVLTGKFADAWQREERAGPRRFDPFPWYSMGIWISRR